jgi:hypothetical protein
VPFSYSDLDGMGDGAARTLFKLERRPTGFRIATQGFVEGAKTAPDPVQATS